MDSTGLITKTYLRYVHDSAFGIIASARTATVTDASGHFAFAPAIHEVRLSHAPCDAERETT